MNGSRGHCESKTFSIEQLYNKYQNKEIMKPQIQRSICWTYKPSKTEDKTNDYDFIKFICETGNLVNPLIMVERIHDNEKKLFMIDGNNRMNAIINFIRRPLMLIGDDILSDQFSQEVKNELYKTSYRDLHEYSLTDLFELSGKEELLTKNAEKFPRVEMIKSYKETINELRKLGFMNIEVPVTKFENLNEQQLVNLYAGLNRTGVRLTEQDILASTTSFIRYTESEIINYTELRETITKYYNNMNTTEVLMVEFNTESLNLFEVIMAMKIIFKEKFSFIPTYGGGVQKLEFLFQWYRSLFGGFNTKIDINIFERTTWEIFNVVKNIISNMYVAEIKLKLLSDHKVIFVKRHMSVIFFYLWKDITKSKNGAPTIDAVKKVQRCIYYNQILDYCSGKKIPRSDNDKITLLKDKCSLNSMIAKLRKTDVTQEIIEEINLDNPTRDQFVELLNYAMAHSIEEPKKARIKRKTMNKFYALLLSEYFRSIVPMASLNSEKSVEHIIPFSSKFIGGKLGDIDRIGNLTLIDTIINSKRGNARITDEFIKKNKLLSLAYPTEKEYNTICNDLSDIISLENFNSMCARRERIFCECLISTLYD